MLFFRGEEVSDVEVLFLCVSEGQQTLLNRFGSSFLVGSFLCIKSSNFLGSLAKVRFIIQVQLSSSACFDLVFSLKASSSLKLPLRCTSSKLRLGRSDCNSSQ